jgi:hypothetical protein
LSVVSLLDSDVLLEELLEESLLDELLLDESLLVEALALSLVDSFFSSPFSSEGALGRP